jgi:ankyrin repeat protein
MTASSAFFDAIKAGDLAHVKSVISETPEFVNLRNDEGQSAVLAAVYHHRKDIADLLVSRGAELSIFEACAAGEEERVERFLGDPAVNVNAVSDDGWTALHLASFFGHAKIVEMLIAHGADATALSRNESRNTSLHAALAANRKIVAGLLIGAGADVNAADRGGWRPLHLASANNNLDLVKALIAQGADVHLANNDGATPLSLALDKGHREVEAFLRRQGA